MDAIATVTTKGQITLPKKVREALGLKTGDRVLFRILERGAVMAKTYDLLDLAGAVPTPPEIKDVSWAVIRDRAWEKAAERSR